MSRGYVAVALHNPKCVWNIGGVIRAIGCYDADLLLVGGFGKGTK